MLSDDERKTLLVLFHFSSRHNRMPTWHELRRLTGRRKMVLHKAIQALQQKGVLKWDGVNLSSIQLDRAWDVLL